MEVYLFLTLKIFKLNVLILAFVELLTVCCGLCRQIYEHEASLQPVKHSIYIYSTYVAVLCIVTNCSK